MREILSIFEVIPATEIILSLALASKIKDYEDAMIEVSEVDAQINYIVTGNLKDFKKSRVRGISPEELLLVCLEG